MKIRKFINDLFDLFLLFLFIYYYWHDLQIQIPSRHPKINATIVTIIDTIINVWLMDSISFLTVETPGTPKSLSFGRNPIEIRF